MKISRINYPNSMAFNGKMRTRFILESVGGHYLQMSNGDELCRIQELSGITGVPAEKLSKKLSNYLDLRLFMSSVGAVLKNRFPKFEKAGEKFTNDLFKLISKPQNLEIQNVEKLIAKYDKKLGNVTEINLSDGEKKFFNNYIDNCF